MNKLRGRLIFDLVLSAMLIFEMFFQLTGDFLHEVVGVAFFVTIVAHVALQHKWLSATSRNISQGRKLKTGNKLRMAFGIGLGIATLVLMASSLIISNQLYALAGIDLAGNAYGTWAVIHTGSAYALCALVVGHLLVHWASVASAFRIPYNRERRAAINAGMTAVAVVGMAAIGSRAIDALSVSPAQAVAASDAGSPNGSSSTSQSTPVQDVPAPASSTSSSSSKGKRSKQAASSSSPSTGSSTGSTSAGAPISSSSTSNNATSSSTTVTGTCTLCRKNCPLSAPKCNKPYEAGLI